MKKEEKDYLSKNIQIEEFLSDWHEFWYNTVLYRMEYCPRGTDDYIVIDRYSINTLKRALDKEANVTYFAPACTASSKVISPYVL